MLRISFFRSFSFLIILFLIMVSILFVYVHPLSLENLRHFHNSLQNYHANHPFLTIIFFMGIYIVYALLPLPGIFILSLLAGFLFRQPFSTLYVTLSATIGASLLYFTARSAFGEFFYKRSGQFFSRLEKGIHENAASYLLFLRLIPLFPFWIVNLAGAFFGVSFWVFAWTTFVGMIPSVFIFTQAGRGFTILLQSPDPLNPIHLFNPTIMIALIGLAFLALFPLLKSLKNP